MNRPLFSHRLTVMLIAFFALAFTASIAAAQSAGQLESELGSLSGQMSSAESSDSTADQVISKPRRCGGRLRQAHLERQGG